MRLSYIPYVAAISSAALGCGWVEMARADYGNRAITVVCDVAADNVTVTPFLIWNEELDSFMQKHPNGIEKEGARYTKVFDTVDRTFHLDCVMDSRTVEISVTKDASDNDVLTVRQDKRDITAKILDYVWFASGEEYRVESRKSKTWSECCGAEPGAVGKPMECGPLTRSMTSNCDEVEALRKR